MLLNLFLAILFDSFTDETVHLNKDVPPEILRQRHLNELAKRKERFLFSIILISKMQIRKGELKLRSEKRKRKREQKLMIICLRSPLNMTKISLLRNRWLFLRRKRKILKALNVRTVFTYLRKLIE